jgi:undecaprenyl-diphosphatase
MMTIFDAIVYGFIQGISEFLPVSSSGHLALLPHVMNIQDPGVVFDLMMHLGTALAVIIYFRNDLKRYILTLRPALVKTSYSHPDFNFSRNFIISTIASVVLILALIPLSKLARDPWYIVFNLSFFGAILWWADNYNKKNSLLDSPMEKGINLKLALIIGLAQAMAIFPGVSRSGITLTAALFLGMRRKEAGAYSFLLSLPIILAGILKDIPDLLKAQDGQSFAVLFSGVVSSFIVGWLTIHFFMKLIGKIELKFFSIYRFIIAGIILWTLIPHYK